MKLSSSKLLLSDKNILSLIKFAIVGLLNTVISYLSYAGLVLLNVPWQAASPVSYVAGMANSYLLNKIWTFHDKSRIDLGQIFKFVIVNAASWAAGFLCLWICIEFLFLNKLTAQIPSVAVSILVNYTGNRLWVFNIGK